VKDSLARIQTVPTTTRAQLNALGARAWENHETLVVRLSQVEDAGIRAKIVEVAEHQFGGGS
jgi:hypothetical protein